MRVGTFLTLAAISTVFTGILINHLSHLLKVGPSAATLSPWSLFGVILLAVFLAVAAIGLPIFAMTPAVVRDTIVVRETTVPRESAPTPCDSTPIPQNPLTKIDPPPHKFTQQNVSPPIPPIELSNQRELQKQQEAERRALDKKIEEERKTRLFTSIKQELYR